MIKALLKKQFLEVFSWVFVSGRKGIHRKKSGIIGFGLLYVLLCSYLGVMLYLLADWLCEPLVLAGMGWLYVAIMSLIGMFAGVVGSVFTTHASLYLSKDNDLLFSLPIKPYKILGIRLVGVYSIGLLYESVVMIPGLIAFWRYARLSVIGYLCSALVPLVLSLLILVLSAVLGYFVAAISAKMKHKNIIIVAICSKIRNNKFYI